MDDDDDNGDDNDDAEAAVIDLTTPERHGFRDSKFLWSEDMWRNMHAAVAFHMCRVYHANCRIFDHHNHP